MLYDVAMLENALEFASVGIDEPVKQMLVSLKQYQNANEPIEVATGNDAVVKLVHYMNAFAPIEVAFGKDAVVILLHYMNADAPIEVAFGKDTVVRL